MCRLLDDPGRVPKHGNGLIFLLDLGKCDALLVLTILLGLVFIASFRVFQTSAMETLYQ